MTRVRRFVLLSVVALGCRSGANEPPIESRQRAIDFETGSVQGTLLWHGEPAEDQSYFLYEPGAVQQSFFSPSYALPNVTPGAHTIAVYDNGCFSNPSHKLGEASFDVAAGSSAAVDIDLTATAGRVRGSISVNRSPVAGARVEMFPDGGCSVVSASTGTDGTFSRLVAPGTYTANVRVNAIIIGTFAFSVDAAGTADVGPVDLATASVQGTLLWHGEPAEDQSYFLYEQGSVQQSFFSPSYALPNVTPGAHTIAVYDNGCFSNPLHKLGEASFDVAAGSSTAVDIDLTATAGRVRGSISVNGSPVAGARVEMFPDGGCSVVSASTGTDGTFSRLVAPGNYTANVRVNAIIIGTFAFAVDASETTDIDSVNTPAEPNVKLDLLGGTAKPNGMSLTFDNVTTEGTTVVVKSGSCVPSCSPPPTGYAVVGARYWDISTTAKYTDQITVCIAYDPQDVCGTGKSSCVKESLLRLVHDAGNGFKNITNGPVDTVNKKICGVTPSLSPFAIVAPIESANTPPSVAAPADMTLEAAGPAGAQATFDAAATDTEDGLLIPTCVPASGSTFPVGATQVTCNVTDSGGLPASASFTVTVRDTIRPAFGPPLAPIVATATSTSGATVTYSPPAATDAADSNPKVACTPASGSKFVPGRTTVNCTASDASGNTSATALTVWVQYDAPSDGTFFLKPIRPDGSSIFKIGRPVPVKFRLVGASAGITNLVAKLSVAKISDQIRGTAIDESDEDGDETDFLFKYRKAKGIYAYRWKTRGETQGTYRLRADLGDEVIHEITVSLKASK